MLRSSSTRTRNLTNRQTLTWQEFETSVDAYRLRLSLRQAGAEHGKPGKERLAGLDDAYRTMREMLSGRRRRRPSAPRRPHRSDAEQRCGHEASPTSTNFGPTACDKLVAAVRDVALTIARDALDGQEHVLWDATHPLHESNQTKRWRSANGCATAPQRGTSMPPTSTRRGQSCCGPPLRCTGPPGHQSPHIGREEAAAAEELRAAETLVLAAAQGHPVVRLPGFDLERLARTPADRVPELLLGAIDARDRAVDQVRQALRDDPDWVLELEVDDGDDRAARHRPGLARRPNP